jgi:pimeloyl-ACP methyl ester carboxylesterase
VAAFLGGGPDEVPDRFAVADPMRGLPLGVPAVLVHGDRDDRVPVAVSQRYVTAARAAGDHAVLSELPGVGHFEVIDPSSEAWAAVLDALARLGTSR